LIQAAQEQEEEQPVSPQAVVGDADDGYAAGDDEVFRFPPHQSIEVQQGQQVELVAVNEEDKEDDISPHDHEIHEQEDGAISAESPKEDREQDYEEADTDVHGDGKAKSEEHEGKRPVDNDKERENKSPSYSQEILSPINSLGRGQRHLHYQETPVQRQGVVNVVMADRVGGDIGASHPEQVQRDDDRPLQRYGDDHHEVFLRQQQRRRAVNSMSHLGASYIGLEPSISSSENITTASSLEKDSANSNTEDVASLSAVRSCNSPVVDGGPNCSMIVEEPEMEAGDLLEHPPARAVQEDDLLGDDDVAMATVNYELVPDEILVQNVEEEVVGHEQDRNGVLDERVHEKKDKKSSEQDDSDEMQPSAVVRRTARPPQPKKKKNPNFVY
jgi:hypothetical protein